jgi:hypothetical protein
MGANAMTLITENGWTQCSAQDTDNGPVPGTGIRLPVRAGDAAVILKAWAAWYNNNIEPLRSGVCGCWTPTNDVWNSNHLSGTALDLNWNSYPFRVLTMPSDRVAKVESGLGLFRGVIFWGRNWASPKDEMHYQLNYPEQDTRVVELANDLRTGYLGIYAPPDPNAFPLPPGYYYGPIDGPTESISCEFEGDMQSWKDGLGRWQSTLGLTVTKKWNDGVTPKAATTMQLEKNWSPNPLFGHGGVYLGEWDAVIGDGWRLPDGWDPSQVPDAEPPITKWGDYSQYQCTYICDAYPYAQVAFRASIADQIDAKFAENMKRAKAMVASGRLKKIIAYHFWVPGHDNFGTFRQALEQSGGVFPELAFMLDVEDGGAKWNVSGDQSAGANDFIKKGQEYFNNPQAASGYVNFVANAGLWRHIPRGLKMIVPNYNGPDATPTYPPGITLFGHQYSESEDTPPFGPSDINQSKMPQSTWLAAWGVNGSAKVKKKKKEPVAPVEIPTQGPQVFTDDDRSMLAKVHRLLTEKVSSRSIYRDNDLPVDNYLGILRNIDGMAHEAYIEREALLGSADALATVQRCAENSADPGARKRAEFIVSKAPYGAVPTRKPRRVTKSAAVATMGNGHG